MPTRPQCPPLRRPSAAPVVGAWLLVAGLAAAVLLGGCARAPQVLKANEAGMSIALDSDVDSLAEAVEVANQHCVNVRRIAVLDRVSEIKGRRIAFFDCVEVS